MNPKEFVRRLWREGSGLDLPGPSRRLLSFRSLFWLITSGAASALIVFLLGGNLVAFVVVWAVMGPFAVFTTLPHGNPG